jgi:hypothetical protein
MRKPHSEHFSTAVPQKADVVSNAANGSFVPGSDICAAANSTLFDHLVGAGARAPRAGGLTRLKRNTGTAVVHIDDDVDNLPFIVRRDHRIVAAFAKKRHANVRKGPDCKTRDTNGGGMLAPP